MRSVGMTFKKAFNDIFSKGLKVYGFNYCKKYEMCIKCVNNELIQYITYLPNPVYKKNYKSYTVFSGIVSVYCSSISKEMLMQYASGIYYYVYHFFEIANEKINGYEYDKANMLYVINCSLEDTCKTVIPIFNKVVNLDTYIEYRKKIGPSAIAGAKDFLDDSLALIKSNNHDDFQDVLQREIEILNKWEKDGKLGGTFEDAYNLIYDGIITSIVKSRDEVYNNPQLYAKALEEANRRKNANFFILYENDIIQKPKQQL